MDRETIYLPKTETKHGCANAAEHEQTTFCDITVVTSMLVPEDEVWMMPALKAEIFKRFDELMRQDMERFERKLLLGPLE